MQNLSALVKGIDQKTKLLADKYKAAQRELESCKVKVSELEEKNRLQSETINELEQKIHSLKIIKSIHKGKDTADARKRINEMLRELDRCIDLLNKTPI